MLTTNDYLVQEARFEDMRRKAMQQAEANAARSITEHDEQALFAATLANVGKAMVEIGSRLQDRYGTLADDTPPSAAAPSL